MAIDSGNGRKTPRRDSYEGNPLLAGISRDYITFNGTDESTSRDDLSRLGKVRGYLTADISTRWADLILIVCFALSGLIDSGAYNAYECFTSMQTGNTIFAALGVSNLPVPQPRYAWTKSVCSIIAFLLGAGVFGFLHRAIGERKRWVLAASFILQAVMIAVAAHLVARGHASGSPAKKPSIFGLPSDPGFPWMDLVPIGLLSFQAAGKITLSRALQYNGLPVVVLTTIYHDLVTNPAFYTNGLSGNPVRNRKVAGLVFYFGGAVAGGAFARSPVGFSGLLWTAAGVTLLIAVAWLFWREEAEKDEFDES